MLYLSLGRLLWGFRLRRHLREPPSEAAGGKALGCSGGMMLASVVACLSSRLADTSKTCFSKLCRPGHAGSAIPRSFPGRGSQQGDSGQRSDF